MIGRYLFNFCFFLGLPPNVTRLQIFELLLSDSLLSRANTAVARRKVVDYVKCRIPDWPEDDIINKISLFSNKIVIRWKASGKNKNSFLKRNDAWLKEQIYRHALKATPFTPSRAIKSFVILSNRSKRRRTKKLVCSHSPEELVFATQSSLMKKGKRNVAHAIKKRSCQNVIEEYTPEEALAVFVDSKLTRSQYTKLRSAAKNEKCNLYPSYDEILEAKKHVTESKGEVKLKSLLNHIVGRLAIVQNEVLSREINEKN
nr:unnamed protein product [Callosobruchus analis]